MAPWMLTRLAANSGVFVYLTDPKGWVQNSVEIQITDDHAEKWANANPTWRCEAVLGRLAAGESRVRAAGEWNHYTIICRGQFMAAYFDACLRRNDA